MTPPPDTITAAAHWRCIDCVSDLHLHHADATWHAFAHYLQHTQADALFLLGDIFEAWVGDDLLHSDTAQFERQVIAALAALAQRGTAVYWIHGNRDFLVGTQLATRVPLTLLSDPAILHIAHAQAPWQRVLLSHGDALCISDVDYMQFRATVRHPAWQQAFLQKPLAERLLIARHMRQHSHMRQQNQKPQAYADVDTVTALQWLRQHHCTRLIHGHTHRPADHVLTPDGSAPPATPTQNAHATLLCRHVLTDWDINAHRAEVLRLHAPPAHPIWTLERIDCTAQR